MNPRFGGLIGIALALLLLIIAGPTLFIVGQTEQVLIVRLGEPRRALGARLGGLKTGFREDFRSRLATSPSPHPRSG